MTSKTAVAKNRTFQEELKNTLEKIRGFKLSCEANIVSILWKEPSLIYDCDTLKLDDFDENKCRVFWQIAYDLTVLENKSVLDDITVGIYLGKHEKLQQKFEEYGGMTTIQTAKEYVQEENLEGYIKELHKWNSVMRLAERGFPVNNRLSDFADMSIEDIYDEYEVGLNHVFANADVNVKSHPITDGIDELIEKLSLETTMGLPFDELPMLTNELGGIRKGDVMLIGGVSNAGKSSLFRMAVLASAIRQNEPIVVFLNEEGLNKWQRELLVWVANNIFNMGMQKYQVRDGNYTPELKADLIECASWIKSRKVADKILLVPLEKYSTSMVIKLIKKYSAIGFSHFAIDTFKMDNADGTMVNDNTRLQMVQNMTMLYNTVKESARNVSLICTVQLTKGSSRTRYLTLDAIGESKNIIDPCATALFVRTLFEDEYPDGTRPITVEKYSETVPGAKQKITLDREKKYLVIFVAKGRESAAGVGSQQFIVEIDYSRNTMREVGLAKIVPDF